MEGGGGRIGGGGGGGMGQGIALTLSHQPDKLSRQLCI